MNIKPEIVNIGEKIRAVFVPAEGFKTTLITVDLLVPRQNNIAENIILPKTLTFTSKKYSDPISLSAKKEELYGAIVGGITAKRGEGSKVELYATCIDNRLALGGENISQQCLELLLELLFNPDCENGRFKKEVFDLQKRLAVESIESEKNDKRLYAFTRMIETMCQEEVFGISTDEILEEIEKSDEASLYKAWEQLLKTASVQISVTGNFDKEKAVEAIENAFSHIERAPVETDTLFVESAQDVTELTEDMDINQSKLVIGYRCGMTDRNDDIYARQVMVDIFGGGPYSRLFTNVREKLSLCYYCSARFYREKGFVAIQSGIEADNRQKVLQEIAAQLEVMKKGEFTDEEFTASKTAICDSISGVFDTPDGIDNYISSKIDDEIISIDEVIRRYEAVTREDVVRAANEMSLDTVYMLRGRESADE